MNDVQISWPNKDLTLYASGLTDYQWVDPKHHTLSNAPELVNHSSSCGSSNSNLVIIGDGLDAIDALVSKTDALTGGIRLLYIDPPFNTQGSFRQYSDSMKRSMWLSMFQDRLLAIKPHLTQDSSVWVHLDDSEVHRARMVMDEIFGEGAFVASVTWQKKTTRDSRAAFSTNHDTILVYAPSGPKKWKTSRNLLAKDEANLQNRDNDPRGPWTDAPFTAPGFRKAQQYDILSPSGEIKRPPRGRSWYATEPTFQSLLEDDRIWFPKNGAGSPRLKLFPHQLRGLVPFTVWGSADVGSNDDAKRHLLDLFPEREVFDTPKPEELLERIIHISTNPGDLVVDLFAGSGTTAAVSHKMRRRWITVERIVDTALEFAIPRLNAVVNGSDHGGVTKQASWKAGGYFEVLQVIPRFGSLGRGNSAAAVSQKVKELTHHEASATG
ncbi:site-specific DNA-methyltransferase [Glutamicibacter sp.]|uniref:site-specific DNA-methyltransferase n=1 Tax=Glutamicibacter sp. TaxID=1931995 RepID=UPI003D6AFD26